MDIKEECMNDYIILFILLILIYLDIRKNPKWGGFFIFSQ